MRVKLGDVCECASSNLKQSDVLNKNGDFPIYGAAGYIGNVDFYHQDKPYIAVVKDGAGIGRTKLYPANSSVIGTMQYLLPKDNILPQYLCYVVQYMHLEKYFSGATIPHIYFRDYKNEEFNLESIERQAEIIDVLQHIEKIMNARKQELKKLDELVKARFVEMFGNPEYNSLGWNEVKLSEHLDVLGGYAFKSDMFDENVGIPVLRIGNINAGHFVFANMVYWKEDKKLERYIMYPGDLVMSLTGTVGKDDYGNVCILGKDFEKYYLNQRNAKLDIKDGINKYYLAELLRVEGIKRRLTGISRGVRQANISNKDILNLVVPLPPMELQEQFAIFVTQTDKSKFLQNSSCKS
jgi:type I restriction enzyme S subunit